MSSPYGPSGGNDPQQWGQQPYGGGYPGTPSGGFPAQGPGYGQPQQQSPYGQPQYPGQFGQPGGFVPQQPEKKSNAVLWVVVALVVLVVGAFAFTAFVTPGFLKKKIFDNTAVQNGIVKILKDEYKISDVSSATCTGEHEVKPKATFDCKVQVGGKDRTVKITVKTTDGEYEVGQPTG